MRTSRLSSLWCSLGAAVPSVRTVVVVAQAWSRIFVFRCDDEPRLHAIQQTSTQLLFLFSKNPIVNNNRSTQRQARKSENITHIIYMMLIRMQSMLYHTYIQSSPRFLKNAPTKYNGCPKLPAYIYTSTTAEDAVDCCVISYFEVRSIFVHSSSTWFMILLYGQQQSCWCLSVTNDTAATAAVLPSYRFIVAQRSA